MDTDTVPQLKAARTIKHRMALKFGSRVPVFPCKADKTPHTQRGHLDATKEASRINMWWNRHPDANPAMPTGERSGRVFVLDVDADKWGFGSLEALENEHGELPATYTVKTGRGGLHLYFRYPEGAEIPNSAGKVGAGLDIRGEGGYVLLPGSTTEGTYEALEKCEISDAPEWLVELVSKPQAPVQGSRRREGSTIHLDDEGPIPEGTRDDTLTRIAGRLHDGTRTLGQLIEDLMGINEERCSPPLPERDVQKIARSIHRREPCKPAAKVTAAVLAKVDRLEEAARDRAIKGIRGATGWAIYNGGLSLLRRFGKEHPDGLELSVDMRTWGLEAGTCGTTVSNFIRRSPLVRRLRRGSGRRSGSVVFIMPPAKGVQLGHSPIGGVSKDDSTPGSVHGRPLFRTLYRLRWGPGRIGKSRAALLTAMVECPGVSRFELAHRLGRKPESLKKPLKWLVDSGLAVRVGWGRYDVPEDLSERLDDARELGREPEAERLQIARHERERNGYRNRKKVKPDPHLANRKADGHISELERAIEDHSKILERPDRALRDALEEYLRRNPHRRGEYPSWLAVALWADEYLETKPPPVAVEAALADLQEVAA